MLLPLVIKSGSSQPVKEIFPVFVIFENPFSLDSSDDNLMQGAGGVHAGLVGHRFQISDGCLGVNKEKRAPKPLRKGDIGLIYGWNSGPGKGVNA